MTGDIVTRFLELLAEAEPSLSEALAASLERKLRHEFAGERVYIAKREDTLADRIAQKFDGRNIDAIAREMHVSRRTVYRAIKKSRHRRENN